VVDSVRFVCVCLSVRVEQLSWRRLHASLSQFSFVWCEVAVCRQIPLILLLMLKPVSGKKIQSPVEMEPKMAGFFGKWGPNLRYWFRDPHKALSRNRVV